MAEPMVLEIEEADKPRRPKAVVKANGASEIVTAPTDSLIIATIAKLSENPELVEQLDKMIGVYERMQAGKARAAFDAAFSEMQPQLPVIAKRGKIKNKAGEVQSQYALWEDVVEQINPILAAHGLAISFRPKVESNKVTVVAILSGHGHREVSDPYELPADTSGSKNSVQSIGSSTSYGKRYTAFALLNLVARGEDDDGGKGGGTVDPNAKVSDAQADELLKLLKNDKGLETRVLVWVGKQDKSNTPATVSDIPAWLYEHVAAHIKAAKR